MDNLLKKLADLLKIKNLITLMSTMVFVAMALTGKIDSDSVMLIVGMVYTYFFNKDVRNERE